MPAPRRVVVPGVGMSLKHLYTQRADVYRPTYTPDGSGGHFKDRVLIHQALPVKIDQPASEEQRSAQSYETQQLFTAYSDIVDVKRGDEFEYDGKTYRVWSVMWPSRIRYQRYRLEHLQVEGE